MASHAPTTGARSRAPSNILPFKRPAEPLAYAPGVPAFDRCNPHHVRAWNTMIQMALQADRFDYITGEGR
jgi:hypothetical protein